MPYIEQQKILDATNGGLDIIFHYYPQAQEAYQNGKKESKLRDEDESSAILKKLSDNNWVITDFGDDATPRNGIQVCAKEEKLSYGEAVALLGARYKIGALDKAINKPGYEKRDAKPDEKEGIQRDGFKIKEKIEDWELGVLGPKVNHAVCQKYNVFSLHEYIVVSGRVAHIWKSNPDYPIFLFDCGEFMKIYQPFAHKKKNRFMYVGNRPKDWINGMAQVRKAYADLQNIQQDGENDGDKKLDEIILCSGERDALNVAGLGYLVIWLNSETAKFESRQYKKIMEFTHVLYNLPDIDSTGKRQAIKLGMQYLDIKTIWLPEKIKDYKDHRGNPKKDFLDYIQIYHNTNNFNKLIKVAMPLKFWDVEETEKGVKYHVNNSHAYYFLVSNGFYRFENKNVKGGKQLIRIQGNIVKSIEPDDAKSFINRFLEERYMPIPLRNTVYRTNQLTEGSLTNLPTIDLDFKDTGKHFQFMFFLDTIWEITANGIKEHMQGSLKNYIWEDELVKHSPKIKDIPFDIKLDNENSCYSIDIKNTDSLLFKYLINTCRVHWQAEFERAANEGQECLGEYKKKFKFSIFGDRLEEEEINEHIGHLVNKIFVLGYLLHRYKDPSRPWLVWAMDNKIGEMGKSFGRSGKSVCFESLKYYMRTVKFNSRNPKLFDNSHVFDRVTEHVDLLFFNDAFEYFNFAYLFESTQGSTEVNPKNNQSYEIPFEESPKIVVTSNFMPKNIDDSTEGRLIYSSFCDYYHIASQENNFESDHTIRDDIGKNLYLDYDEKDWENDINFLAACVSFYLSVPSPKKINPPLGNVLKRNLMTIITEPFKEWADVYFNPKSENVDALVSKVKAFEAFQADTKNKKWIVNRFTKSLKAWARYTEWVVCMDPKEMKNSQDRIIRKVDGTATEMIYIQTKHEIDLAGMADEDENDNEIVFPPTNNGKLF